MAVSCSIVLHNTSERLFRNLLECMLRENFDRIYIIDNSPQELLYAKKLGIDNNIIDYRHVENKGFGAAHNIALREVCDKFTGYNDYHLIINPDVRWKGLIIDKLTNHLNNNPEIGMLMPKVYYPDGALQLTCRMLPTPTDLFAKRFLPSAFTKKRMEKFLLEDHDHEKSLNCPYLLGSFLIFRNKALKECGIFDERFFMYPEDIDITRRIHRKWETIYWPKVDIIHDHAAASRKNLKMFIIHFTNMIKYFNKWGWFYDKERKEFNKKLRKEITFLPPVNRPESRG